jgi:succinate dehydrogenase / fumarate reductase cytochrome b subunit
MPEASSPSPPSPSERATAATRGRSGPRRARPQARAQYRNLELGQLLSYRLPAAGLVSILHRISGALLFLVGIPFTLYLFQQSLRSEISFDRYRALVGSVPGKLILLILIWSLAHHLVAGIRYLILDLHIGIEKAPSAMTARIVLGLGLLLTALFALRLFGAV